MASKHHPKNYRLTGEDRKTIIKLRQNGMKQRVIAEMFGVTQQYVSRLWNGYYLGVQDSKPRKKKPKPTVDLNEALRAWR